MLFTMTLVDIKEAGFATLTADAAGTTTTYLVTPKISKRYAYSNKIEINVSNAKKYDKNTVFDVYVNGDCVKTTPISSVNKNGYIGIYYNIKTWFKPNTTYKIQLRARKRNSSSVRSKLSSTLKIKTDKQTYYYVKSGTKYYSFKNKKFSYKGRTSGDIWEKAKTTNKTGIVLAGKAKNNNSEVYIRLDAGKYKGYYVKLSESCKVRRVHKNTALRQTVCKYAAGMNGGSYVSCGTRYRATDCSGLTMLAYQQIGINLPHSAAAQANYGKRVSTRNMQPGDIIICNGYGHAMLYLGDGKVIHAMNYYDGIQIQNASTAMRYNPVNKVVRLI